MNPTTRRAHANESNDPKVHSGSLCSFRRALGDVLVVRVRSVQTGASWMWSGSFGFVGFLRGVPVNFGTLGSFRHILEVVGFIRARIWCRRFFLGFVVFIRTRPGGGWAHLGTHLGLSGSLGLFMRYVGVLGFVLVHLCAAWGSSCSFGFHSGVFGRILVSCFILFRLVHSCPPCGSLGSFGCALRVVGFSVSFGSFGCGWSCSYWYVGFVRAHPGGRPVHLGSLGSFEHVVGVVRFIRVRCALGVVRFIRGLVGFVEIIQGSLGSSKCDVEVIGFIWFH